MKKKTTQIETLICKHNNDQKNIHFPINFQIVNSVNLLLIMFIFKAKLICSLKWENVASNNETRENRKITPYLKKKQNNNKKRIHFEIK